MRTERTPTLVTASRGVTGTWTRAGSASPGPPEAGWPMSASQSTAAARMRLAGYTECTHCPRGVWWQGKCVSVQEAAAVIDQRRWRCATAASFTCITWSNCPTAPRVTVEPMVVGISPDQVRINVYNTVDFTSFTTTQAPLIRRYIHEAFLSDYIRKSWNECYDRLLVHFDFGIFLNFALELKKYAVCQMYSRPSNQYWSLFPALWSFCVWPTFAEGRRGGCLTWG